MPSIPVSPTYFPDLNTRIRLYIYFHKDETRFVCVFFSQHQGVPFRFYKCANKLYNISYGSSMEYYEIPTTVTRHLYKHSFRQYSICSFHGQIRHTEFQRTELSPDSIPQTETFGHNSPFGTTNSHLFSTLSRILLICKYFINCSRKGKLN